MYDFNSILRILTRVIHKCPGSKGFGFSIFMSLFTNQYPFFAGAIPGFTSSANSSGTGITVLIASNSKRIADAIAALKPIALLDKCLTKQYNINQLIGF